MVGKKEWEKKEKMVIHSAKMGFWLMLECPFCCMGNKTKNYLSCSAVTFLESSDCNDVKIMATRGKEIVTKSLPQDRK